MSYVQPLFIFYDEKSGCSYLSDGQLILSAAEHADAIRTLTRFLENHDLEAINRLRLQQCQNIVQETLSVSLEKRPFNRSKNRSKSWVSRCKNCNELIDDAVMEFYWWRRDLDDAAGHSGPFCSKECAISIHPVEVMAQKLFKEHEESTKSHPYFGGHSK